MKNLLDLQRQAGKALPHVSIAGREANSNAARKSNHRRRSCPASASITRYNVTSSGAPSIVSRTLPLNVIVMVPRRGSEDGPRSAAAALTATGTNAGPSPAAANRCRHRYNRLVLTSARRATSDALASGSFNAKIQRIFSARVQYRRFSFDVMTSTVVMARRLLAMAEGGARRKLTERRVEMLFAHLKRIQGSIDCVCGVRTGRRTSSYWPPPPRICGNWRSSSRLPRRPSSLDALRRNFTSLTIAVHRYRGRSRPGSSTKSDPLLPFKGSPMHGPQARENGLPLAIARGSRAPLSV
jgi:hypothetical protein